MIEALWAVNFSTPMGSFGAGVVVLETGRVFGGDSLYYYLGDYTVDGKTVRGTVSVIHYSGPPMNVFGPIEKLTLQFEGQMAGDTMQAIGIDPTNPQRRLTMKFRRLANLP
jgi:T3SS negative regulator,GrlR